MNKTFKKILERLEDELTSLKPKCCTNIDFDKGIYKAQEIVQEVAEEYKSTEHINYSINSSNCGWIPCNDSDKLPPNDVDVLVWFEYYRYGRYNRLYQTLGISSVINGEWSGIVNDSTGWRQLRIIAWRPLPEPYNPDNMTLTPEQLQKIDELYLEKCQEVNELKKRLSKYESVDN